MNEDMFLTTSGATRREFMRSWGAGALIAATAGGVTVFGTQAAAAPAAEFFFVARADAQGRLQLIPEIPDASGLPNVAAGGRAVSLQFPPDVVFLQPGEVPGGRQLLLEPGSTVVGYGDLAGSVLNIRAFSLEPPAP